MIRANIFQLLSFVYKMFLSLSLPYGISRIFHIFSLSCCCVKKPPRNWRRSRRGKLRRGGASSRNAAENQRTSMTPTKVLCSVAQFYEKSLSRVYTRALLLRVSLIKYLKESREKSRQRFPEKKTLHLYYLKTNIDKFYNIQHLEIYYKFDWY